MQRRGAPKMSTSLSMTSHCGMAYSPMMFMTQALGDTCMLASWSWKSWRIITERWNCIKVSVSSNTAGIPKVSFHETAAGRRMCSCGWNWTGRNLPVPFQPGDFTITLPFTTSNPNFLYRSWASLVIRKPRSFEYSGSETTCDTSAVPSPWCWNSGSMITSHR